MFAKLCLSVTVFAVIAAVYGYPSGAPSSACDKLEPKHSTHKKLRGFSPFQITTNKQSYAKNEKVVITIQGKNATTNLDVPFKGFMLVARKVGTKNNVGLFKATTNAKTMNCSIDGDAITHKKDDSKTKVMLEWMPGDTTGSVSFTGVVAEEFDRYWAGLRSRPITIQ